MLKHPLEMIAIWRTGCSKAGPAMADIPGHSADPADCAECTNELINAIEKALRNPELVERGALEEG